MGKVELPYRGEDSMNGEQTLDVFAASFAGKIGGVRRNTTPPLGIYSRTWGRARDDRRRLG